MDLGATVCTARAPHCLLCPLSTLCAAHAEGREAEFPVKPARKAKPERSGTALWIAREGQVRLVTRPAKGMLGGMRALPDDGWSARRDGSGEPPVPLDWTGAGTVIHTFTHFTLELAVRVAKAGKSAGPDGLGEWWAVEALDAAGLPTLFAKAAQRATES